MRLRLSRIMDITTQLESIATDIEQHFPKLALAIDTVCDRLEGRTAGVDLSKLPEALQNVLKGIKMPSSVEQAKMVLKKAPVPAPGVKNAFDPTMLVQGVLGALLGLTFIPIALKGGQMLGQVAVEAMVSAVKALKGAKNPAEFLKAWKANASKLGLDPAAQREFEGSPAFKALETAEFPMK